MSARSSIDIARDVQHAFLDDIADAMDLEVRVEPDFIPTGHDCGFSQMVVEDGDGTKYRIEVELVP